MKNPPPASSLFEVDKATCKVNAARLAQRCIARQGSLHRTAVWVHTSLEGSSPSSQSQCVQTTLHCHELEWTDVLVATASRLFMQVSQRLQNRN
jgi:hypothetical protein